MGARQNDWARLWRLKLRRLLGMRCWGCNSRDYRKLTFDVMIPCGSDHHRYSWSWRISFYRAQHRKQNLALLCDRCNSRKGDDAQTDFPYKPKVIGTI